MKKKHEILLVIMISIVFLIIVGLIILNITPILNEPLVKITFHSFGEFFRKEDFKNCLKYFMNNAFFLYKQNNISYKSAFDNLIKKEFSQNFQNFIYIHEIEEKSDERIKFSFFLYIFFKNDKKNTITGIISMVKSSFFQWKIESINSDEEIFFNIFFK